MKRNIMSFVMLLLIVALLLSACGGGGGSSSTTSSSSSSSGGVTTYGAIQLSFLDAPGDYDHVWITVKSVWFHTSSAAGPHDPAWLKYPLATPATIDLIALANGNVSQDPWNGIRLPVGTYQQIRLLLVPTYAANPPAGHGYFNEVVVGSTTTPLRIPDADDGIRLAGSFAAAGGTPLRLAIDFDAGDDVVEFSSTEYILKPRLTYFDLDNAAAIVGQLSTGTTFTTAPHFVVKAEKLSSDGTRHVVHRVTVPDSTGKFVLYPLSASTTTTTYDILVRGLGYRTTIIKNVPAAKGSTAASNPTLIPAITMATGTDYAGSGAITSPTGAWIDYFQTLPGAGEVPYEVRFRHFHPITGSFTGFLLSNSQLQWGVYSSNTITLTAVAPAEGTGSYQAIAGADDELYDSTALPGAANANVSATPLSARLATFGTLTVKAPWRGNSASGVISMASPTLMNNRMDAGVVFAVHGGMIIDAVSTARSTLSASDVMTGGTYTLSNLPGGTAQNALPTAFYGIDAAFWSSTNSMYRAVAIPQVVDLRTTNDTADLQLQPLW